MASHDDELPKSHEWSDRAFARQVRKFAEEQLDNARRLHATWSDYFSLSFLLMSSHHAIKVRFARMDSCLRLAFANSEAPDVCNLYIDNSDVLSVEYSASKVPDVKARFQRAMSMGIGLPESAYYGWVEEGRVTALLGGSQTYEDIEATYCPGVDGYVLQGFVMPRQLHMSTNGADDYVTNWLKRVWGYVQTGQLVRLNERIKQLPGEMWMVCQDHQAWIIFDAVDNRPPAIAPGRPYMFWHPREARPNQLNLLANWPNVRNPLRKWVD